MLRAPSSIARSDVSIGVPIGTLMAIAIVSCSKATEVTVVVTSDAPCEALKGVSITAASAADVDTRPASTITERCAPNDGGSRIGSLVIAPRENDSKAELAIRVTAGVAKNVETCSASDGFSGCIVARRVTRFASGENLTMHVALRVACTDRACDSATTCVRGACRNAHVAPDRCSGASGCDEDALGESTVDAGPAGPDVPDAGDAGVLSPDAAVACADGEKTCGGKCVKKDDPLYGCADTTCDVCPGISVAMFACVGGGCALTACTPGYKLCGGNCVPTDASHGCANESCEPCESTNATATCDSARKCTLVCKPDTKFCGGRCVRIDDPTYGCTATSCSAAGCPNAGSGTLVCNGSTCAIGACGPGTKKCGASCVPTDANNGCASPTQCTPCPQGNVCTGAPSACTCVPEPLSVTCATRACGPAVNNCGQNVTCPNTCAAPTVCGADGNPNTCYCNPDNVSACLGKACGTATNNCGQTITCPNTCSGYNTCGGGGAGPNGCGCTPIPFDVACANSCREVANGCGGYYSCPIKKVPGCFG